eukprot:COSAG06_NODE_10518_length_1667_cov_2.087372_1_plen_172_part_10
MPLPRLSPTRRRSNEKRHVRRAGSAQRAGRLGRRAMTMAIRAKVWHSVRRGDEGRRPRVAVALGLLVRPPRPGQSGRGGARGRVTLFQRRCWFGMSACLAPRSPTCRTKTGAPRQGGNRLTTQAGRTESIRSQQNAQFPSAVCCWQDGGNSRQARVLLLVHVDEHLHDLHAL